MAKRNTYSGFHRAFDEGYTSWYNTKKYQADDERRRRDEIARQMEEEEEARREAARLLEEEGRAERGIGGNLVMRNRTNPLSGENRLIGTREASISRMRNAATEYRPTGLSITQEPSYYSSRGLNPMIRVPERVQEYNSRSEDQAEYNRKYRDIVNRARSQYGDDDYAYAAQILINDRKQDDLEAEANRIRQGGGIIGNVNVANPSERLRQIEEERNRLSQRNQQLHDEYTNQQVRSTMARETMGQLSDLSRQGLNPARNFDTGRVTQSAAERIAPLEQFYEYRDSNLVGNSLMAGLNAFNAGALRTLDKAEDFLGGNASRQTVQGVAKLFGKDIDVSDPTRDVADYYQGLQQEYATKASYAKARSIVNEAIGMFAENLGQNLPLMALGPLGGAGAAATNTLATGTGALATQAAQQLISNPSFLLSSMSGMGNTYNDSIASGKTELEAISDALVNGTLSAMIEVGGGIGATEAADAARGLWRNVISTAGEEAMEELWQGLVESAVTSDADTPLFSMQYGEDAIINPVNLGANMLAGAAMGGAFGGMNAVPGAISDAIARGRMDFDAIASDPEVRKYILDPANQPEIERLMGKDDAQRMVTAAAEANSLPTTESQAGKEVQPEVTQTAADTSDNLHTSADNRQQEQTAADTSDNLHTSADNRQQEQTAVRPETDAKPEPYVASGRRATYTPSGEDVDLASTFTVRDGEIYFPTEDGGSMAMGDIEFPDAQTDSLYNSAANYDTAEARAFVSNYTGGDVNSYARGFRAISEAAHVGNALDATVQRSIYAQSIPAPQRQAIYDAALNATEAAPVTAPVAPVAMPAVETAQTSTEAVEAAQAMQEAAPAVTIKGGGVIRETTGKLSHQQRVQVRGMDMLAKKYGVTIRLVDSIDVTMADGTVRRSAANGMYSGGVITVAKDAVGDGYMYVATHEMTHMVRDMGGDSYTLLEDTVLEALRNAGEDVDALISHQMDIHDATGMTDEEFRAYCTEEVVANSIPAILTDKETVRRLVAEDRSLVQKMADFFRDLADTMTEIFEKIKGEASWKQMDALSRNRDTLREIADVFMGALEVAGENAAGAEITYASTESNPEAEAMYSLKNDEKFYAASDAYNDTHKRVPADVMASAEDSRAAIRDIMRDPDMQELLKLPEDVMGNTSFGNASYDRTEENTTVCIRSMAAMDLMDRVAEYLGRPLTVEDSLYVSQELMNYTARPECVYCYVATDRRAYRESLGSYIQQRDAAMADYRRRLDDGTSKKEAYDAAYEKFRDGRKNTKNMRARFGDWVKAYESKAAVISAADLASAKSMADALARDPSLESQIIDANDYAQKASWAKKQIGYLAYDGHILKWKDDRINKLNSQYGLRMYSFSDFSPAFILENMQMITDAAVRGLKVLAYTKELDFVRIFAKTGANINISVRGYMQNDMIGEDAMQGAPWAEARALRDQYPNVGITYVATSDKQIEWAMAQDWVDVVIPYHLVRTGKEVAAYFGFTDYTGESSDKPIKDLWKKGGRKTVYPHEHNNDRDTFLALCEKYHLTPRFSRWLDNPNYMKLVNETRRSAEDTDPVQPVFDTDAAKTSLNTMIREGGYYTPIGGSLEVMHDIAEGLADDIRSGKGSQPTTRFSLKDTTPADTERMAALESENASLREALDIAKSQMKLTQGHRVSDKAVASVARKLLKETQSSYDAETFAENLQQMFDYIANTDADQVAWEDIRDMGVGMAREVLEKSEALDDGVEAYVAEARNYLRTTAISLSDAQKAEAAYAMGSTYNDFRRHLFGNVRLSNSGISLKDAWSELSAMMPDLFPPDTGETDMPALLLEAVDAMKPQYINPYGYDMDGAAYDLFLRMYDAYFDLPEVKTYADKQAAKYAQLKAQYARKIADARTSARERYDARLKALRKQHTEMRQEISRKYAEAKNKADAAHKADMDRLRAQYRALSDRKNEQLLEQKAKFAEWKRSDRERRQESEAVRKYRTRIEKNVKDMADWLTRPTDSHHVPEELRRYVSEWLSGFDFSRSIDRDTKKAQAWRDRLMSVRWALARAENDEDAGGFLMELDPDFLPRLDNFLAKPGTSWYIMRMDSQELAELDYMVSVLKHAITDANKLHANAIYQRIADAAEATKSDLMPMKAWKSRGPRDMFRNFFNLSQSDVFTYFDRLGPAAQSILAELRGGLDKKVDRTYQAQQFTNKAIRGLDMRRITGKDARLLTFKVAGGEIQMTKGQVMELYILNQREQARGHIYGKGIRVVDTKARDAKGRRVYTRSTDPVVVTEADVDTIIASLTQQEREVADSLRDYMSTTVSGWGNEASMAMYGYKKFTEPAYWPIRSDENFTKTQDPEAATSGMYALRNLGMTKQTVKNASNAIMLGDAFDTFCRHIDEMTSYNAFVVPLSDAMRWFNYKGDSRSVKQDIDRVVGPEGKRYFINFVKDLNGATEGASRGLGDVLTRNAKIAAVGSNVRVVIQQPTAYLRAAAVMDSKYLMAGITGAFSAKAHELAMKYAPIVRWKSWGYYDTNMGQSMRDLLIPDRETVASWLQDKSTWLAGVADTVTWNALWRACEAEIKSTRKDLKPGTDDFYKAVGARLSEVIDRTQVVDSVFHKSQLMRSKNGMDKMITNFMAEPTKSYNMLMSAIIKAGQSKQKWKAGKILGRAAMAYAVTAAVNAAMQSFVDAIRDKEKKDKDGNARSYWDKWLDAFWGDYSSIELEELDGTRENFFRNAMTIEESMAEALMNSNLGGNLNPLNLIPYVKDILSILQGYDAPRLDMKGITEVVSVINGLQKWMAGESKWSFAKVMVDTAGGLSYITGIPVSNIIRDVTGVYDLVAKEPIDWESETSTHARSAETLYNALMAGDKDKYNTLLPKLEADREKSIREGEAERIAAGKDPAYANDAAIISEAKYRVQNDIASLLMSNPDIALAYQYRDEGRTSDLSKVYTKFKELGFPADTITMAINKYANTIRESDPKGVRESPAIYDYQSLFGALDRGSMTDFEIIKKDIIAHSDAQDPDDALKAQLTQKYKPLYMGYYATGDTGSMRKLGERLVKTGYFSQGSLDDWCMGHERDGLWKAIEDGDVYEANERINAMRGLGRDDDGLKSSITGKWKPIYRTASASERSSIMDMLARLDVYDSDGNRFYTRERVSKWLDE